MSKKGQKITPSHAPSYFGELLTKSLIVDIWTAQLFAMYW